MTLKTIHSNNALICELDARHLCRMAESAAVVGDDALVVQELGFAMERLARAEEARKEPEEPPCPHPARRGRHETYLSRRGGGFVCRACGKRWEAKP